MAEKKTPAPRKTPAQKRAEHRPRIDAVLRAIKEGKYDDEMNILLGALQDRRSKRQEAVMALVHETFGDDYAVVPRGQRASVTRALHEPPPEGWEDTTAKVAVQEGEVVSSEGPSATMTIEGEEDGIESRSPIIGPVNPS